MNTTIEYTTLSLPVHNRAITCKGYVANLSIGIIKDMRYTVLLKNTFGETRKSFKLSQGKIGINQHAQVGISPIITPQVNYDVIG